MKNIVLVAFVCLLGIRASATDLIESSPSEKLREDRKDGLEVYRHNLNYFISGQPDTKIQLSFKVRLIHEMDIFAAYTQTMFWELIKTESSPFSDLNYNPEIFHRWYLKNGMLKGIDIGFEHRSNGRAGEASRSWNRTYATVRTEFKMWDIDSEWNTKLFYLSHLDETNRDARLQLGFIETSLAVKNIFPSFLREGEVLLTLIPGGTFEITDIRGSRELGIRFRLPIRSFDPYVYLQIYNGFNESLLFYKENRTSYRIGFAI